MRTAAVRLAYSGAWWIKRPSREVRSDTTSRTYTFGFALVRSGARHIYATILSLPLLAFPLGCSPDEYDFAREGLHEEIWLEKLGDGASCIPDDRVHCCAMQNRGPDTPWHCVDWCVDKDWPAVVEQRMEAPHSNSSGAWEPPK